MRYDAVLCGAVRCGAVTLHSVSSGKRVRDSYAAVGSACFGKTGERIVRTVQVRVTDGLPLALLPMKDAWCGKEGTMRTGCAPWARVLLVVLSVYVHPHKGLVTKGV